MYIITIPGLFRAGENMPLLRGTNYKPIRRKDGSERTLKPVSNNRWPRQTQNTLRMSQSLWIRAN